MKENNQEKYMEIIRQLVDLGAYSTNTLNEVLQLAGNKEVVEVLLENGADVTEVWPYELLESPVNCGNIGLVKLLIEHGVVETGDCFSLILDAINGGYEKVVKILIKYADENTKKASGLLEAAIENKNLKIIKILLENGADIELLKQKDMQLALLYDPNIILKDIIKYLL